MRQIQGGVEGPRDAPAEFSSSNSRTEKWRYPFAS